MASKKTGPLISKILIVLNSKRFFWAIVGLLVLQAIWIALTARYPMAFDEDVWLGSIKLYAERLSPFWSEQPAGGDAFGAIVRDPSYLYHYLMSFPYRLFLAITDSQTWTVLLLRGINIGLFAWGLTLYRRLLLKTEASQALVNFCLLVFVLVPIVPQLAGQINWDNLILPLTALTLLWAIKLEASFKARQLDTLTLLQLVALLLFASLVKFAFLPVAAATTAYLLFRAWRVYKRPTGLFRAIKTGFSKLSGWTAYLLITFLLLGFGLFAERYGYNLAKYHTPVPDCGQVLSYDHCKQFGPWIRDYNYAAAKPADFSPNPITYSGDWLHGMWFRSFFAVAGPDNGFQTRYPFLLPGLTAVVLAALSVVAFCLSARAVWRRYNSATLWLLVTVVLFHVSLLWLEEFGMYAKAGQPVAINGRYLLPIMPLILILSALSVSQLLGQHRRLKLALASIAIAGFLWGGGAVTYILRSNDAWYWPNQTVKTVNNSIKDVLGPITPGYDRPNRFLP